ncbi:hypothetical protein AB0I10_40505 [Streptomyces sp. NPDC050636]|uniref:hypothetical protein n=1 Tax=Streptomyces sp. NPDC050636 TaxID=3154510 RepID=UPI00342DB308
MEHRRALALAGAVVAVGASGVIAGVALMGQPAPKEAASKRPTTATSPPTTPSPVPTVEVTRYVDAPVEPSKDTTPAVARGRGKVLAAAAPASEQPTAVLARPGAPERTASDSDAVVPRPTATPAPAGTVGADDDRRNHGRKNDDRKDDRQDDDSRGSHDGKSGDGEENNDD